MDFPASFRTCCALTGAVTFEDDGAVEDIAAEGEVKVFAGIGLESDGLHCRKFIDGCENCGCCESVRI